MTNYDFLILSPYEFEIFCRDILQKHLALFIESFTTGRDGGIDLRYCTDKNKTVIIQAKRFQDYKSLYPKLKEEVAKVTSLKPSKYIIATSVGLTPLNKTEILNLFQPFLKSTVDIFGKDDLNNLLAQHKDIELKYYKLWLSSTVVLERVLHSKIYNQSAFELEEIKSQIGLYVQNNSYTEAVRILNQHHYVIISGIPGIGKTTLSRIMIFALLSKDFEEFIYLSDNIDDAYTFFKENKKQVFFFDDFLGRNFFESKGILNNESKIINFIEKIKKSHDKFLILATREYILNQAKNVYEQFQIKQIKIAKCTLDLSTYTNIIKAQIFYNHLFFSNIPPEYLRELILGNKYLILVKHPNYNPRIIETIINRKVWEHCKPEDFATLLKTYFDNPESVWTYAFENSLNKFAQYTLITLLTLETPVLIEDLEIALNTFLQINNSKFLIPFDSIIFKNAIRELENTFVKSKKDSYTSVAIEYQNPSIQDFLVNYLQDKKDLVNSLLGSIVFFEQIFTIFMLDNKTKKGTKIIIDKYQAELLADRVVKYFYHFKSSKIHSATQSHFDSSIQSHNQTIEWRKSHHYYYDLLKKLREEFPANKPIENLVYEAFKSRLYINIILPFEQDSYIDLISKLNTERLEIDKEVALKSLVENFAFVDSIISFSKLKTVFPDEYKRIVESDHFHTKISDVLREGILSTEDSDYGYLKKEVKNIEMEYHFNFDAEIKEIEAKERDYEEYLENQIDSYMDDPTDADTENNRKEETIIGEIFNSLLS